MKTSTLKSIGIFSISLFATASAVYLYSPVIGTHADMTGNADVNLNVSEVMSLTLDKNALNLNTTPNNFVSGSITATISTNSQYGYTLTLEDVDNSSDMTHTNTSIDSKLTSDFSGSKTSSELETNTWGFSLNATDFYKVPVNGSPVALKRTTTPMTTENESTDITFGAKAGSITSGTYTDKVLFTVYVNGQDGKPTPPTSDPDDPGYVSPCETALYVENNILTDPRDGKTYTVKALKDGKCWMTQNLAIANVELTSENSNLPTGETFTVPVGNDPQFGGTIDTSAAYLDETYGGYYNFYTATAGWGTESVTSGNSPKDICPKGWRLPIGGDDNNEFQTLYENYNSPELMLGEPNFALSGKVYYGISAKGSLGDYWTSTANAANYADYMRVLTSEIRIRKDAFKGSGSAIRCIAK